MSDLNKRLKTIYGRANRELTEKVSSFFERFEEADKKHRALVEEGKLSEKEYQKWRINTLMTGERYKQMQKDVADTLLNVNKVAASYINAEMPGVYASNFNRVGKDAAKQVPGYSFDLVSAQTVRKLATEDKTLLPYKYVDGRKDERWNTKKVNSEILQGIIQGESIPKIAKRLGNVTEMNRESAVRNARTAITGAQNSGRFDGMKQLEDDGVILKKEWVAAVDSHTREAHLELNGQQVDVDEPFVVDGKEIMFPGDPECEYPELVYNCRCALRTVVIGFRSQSTGKETFLEDDSEKQTQQTVMRVKTFEEIVDSDDWFWESSGDYNPASTQKEFMMQNMADLKAAGVKSSAGIREQYENTMMTEAAEKAHQISEQAAVDLARDGIPESLRDEWFVKADSSVKPKISECILGDPDVMNAGWNIAYRNYKETIGAESDISFEEFMQTPMRMFRGTRGQQEIASDVWVSFSMDRKIAESFGDTVEEIFIRPIDTWGSYQTTAEAEILVPKRMLTRLRGK